MSSPAYLHVLTRNKHLLCMLLVRFWFGFVVKCFCKSMHTKSLAWFASHHLGFYILVIVWACMGFSLVATDNASCLDAQCFFWMFFTFSLPTKAVFPPNYISRKKKNLLMPLGLVSTQAPLIFHSTCYTNLLFPKATTVMVLDLLYSIMLPLATHCHTYYHCHLFYFYYVIHFQTEIYCFYIHVPFRDTYPSEFYIYPSVV